MYLLHDSSYMPQLQLFSKIIYFFVVWPLISGEQYKLFLPISGFVFGKDGFIS